MSELSKPSQKGIPKKRLKKYASALAVGSTMLLTATIASNILTNGVFPVAHADDSGGDVCVTSQWKADTKIFAQTGSCATTPAPGGSNPATPISYNGETIVGWASQNLSSISQDESELGVKNGMLSTYVDFVNHKEFPDDFATAAKTRGASLLIAWEPYDMDRTDPVTHKTIIDQTEFKPTAITAGSYDTYLTDWLMKAQEKTKDSAILVRFAPEMNDAVRPWSIGVNGENTRQDYIDMWRHVYNIKKIAAPDVKLMWNPLVAGSDPSGNAVSLTSVYPGSAYVDILALDGFNWGPLHVSAGTCGWQSYNDVFKAPVVEIKTLAAGKPWGIAETASASQPESDFQAGGDCNANWGWVYPWPDGEGGIYKTPQDWITQAGWNRTMMAQAHRDGALFVNLFNTTKETDWRLNSTEDGKAVLGGLSTNGTVTSGNTSSDLIKAALR